MRRKTACPSDSQRAVGNELVKFMMFVTLPGGYPKPDFGVMFIITTQQFRICCSEVLFYEQPNHRTSDTFRSYRPIPACVQSLGQGHRRAAHNPGVRPDLYRNGMGHLLEGILGGKLWDSHDCQNAERMRTALAMISGVEAERQSGLHGIRDLYEPWKGIQSLISASCK
jgi:hypothetical protein